MVLGGSRPGCNQSGAGFGSGSHGQSIRPSSPGVAYPECSVDLDPRVGSGDPGSSVGRDWTFDGTVVKWRSSSIEVVLQGATRYVGLMPKFRRCAPRSDATRCVDDERCSRERHVKHEV
jgi:hypothetical protein